MWICLGDLCRHTGGHVRGFQHIGCARGALELHDLALNVRGVVPVSLVSAQLRKLEQSLVLFFQTDWD